ncbi:MAG: tRNA (guanosine(37)-N1)-methyltransferase TrmD [Thiotrichaceae bacterium]|nr:tRNA (guanosine(37)-N1)-methyltransferase TrmD [Thiotrichaceae bacterium]PCI13690.1 MAG: tRNA (guanosine(37)-N1)-methyltransferase TrmD [Thiotrichales bacterium]
MRIDVVSLFPHMFDALTQDGITGRAIARGLLQLAVTNPRDFTADRHQTVDDRPYGGGPGMVMMVSPLRDAINAAREAARIASGNLDHGGSKVIYMSPQGRRLDQRLATELSQEPNLMLVAGRYEGIDERLIELQIDEEISIGDYVLSGGELAAMVVIDAVTRLLPDALGHADSAQQDSFVDGLLDYPHYTRPEVVDEMAVPEVLRSGNHALIARWRQQQALGRTWLKRPDLLEGVELNKEQRQLLDAFIQEHDAQS